MNKSQLADIVKTKGGYQTKADAEKAIDAFTAAVTEVLTRKEEISLVGFGAFTAAFQKGKEGKVPGKNTTYKTEDKYIPKFKPGKTLRDSVALGK